MNLLFDLFIAFAKIGLFTFGGGYAMISIIADTCVEKKKWITHDDMMNITVIAESTPGPIAVNCATFVGYRQKGIIGAIFSTLGLLTPSIVIIYIIANFLENFLEIKIVANAFNGIKLAVGLLIVDAAVNMIKKIRKKGKAKKQTYVIIVLAALLMFLSTMFSLGISSIVIMLGFGAVTLAVFAAKEKLHSNSGEAGDK